jgi:hypothetical protein
MARKRKVHHRRAVHHKSRRGGASASATCRSVLSTCSVNAIRSGASLRQAGRGCMKLFNDCRTGRKSASASASMARNVRKQERE